MGAFNRSSLLPRPAALDDVRTRYCLICCELNKREEPAFLEAMERCGCAPGETVMIGDQIFTDVWGAHNAGIRVIYIRAIALDTIWRKLRYGIEAPFRGLCRVRGGRI